MMSEFFPVGRGMDDFQEEFPTLTELPETLVEVLVRWRTESDLTRLPRPHVYANSVQETP